jgi:putative transposase
LALVEQAQLLSVSRASLYYQKVEPSEEEVRIKHRIDELYTQYPFYGSRRMSAQLQREGESANRKRVQRYMREMGIQGIAPGPNLSKRNQAHKVYPYLLKGLAISEPNQVWGIDITYIRLVGGWLYLVAILDWYSRYVVSWELSDTLEMPFVVTAVKRAFEVRVPKIFNSDQGSHFTSPVYIEMVKEAGTEISMDGKGRAIDNIFTERLWRSVKYEEVYLKGYGSPREAHQGLGSYFGFYNQKRLHQALDYRTPAEVYLG